MPDPIRRRGLRTRVLADERELPLWTSQKNAAVFVFDPEVDRVGELKIVSDTWRPPDVGARDTGGELGLDVCSVELTREPSPSIRPVETVRQRIENSLNPADAWWRGGFYRDNNWTDGDALISGLDWVVGPDDRRLELTLFAARSGRRAPDELGVRVYVNGIELEPHELDPPRVVFNLYRGLERIEQIRIVSGVFVPRDVGTGPDTRQLGVPIRSLALVR